MVAAEAAQLPDEPAHLRPVNLVAPKNIGGSIEDREFNPFAADYLLDLLEKRRGLHPPVLIQDRKKRILSGKIENFEGVQILLRGSAL